MFNGVDGGSGDIDTADSKDVVGRLLFSPFKTGGHDRLQSLTIGIGGGGKEPARSSPRSPSCAAAGWWFRYRTDASYAEHHRRRRPHAVHDARAVHLGQLGRR